MPSDQRDDRSKAARHGDRDVSAPVALVTGGGRGIGAAICRHLAVDGYLVVVNDLVDDRAESVASGIASVGGEAVAMAADVSNSTSVEALFDEVEARIGPVQTLVNNAGVSSNVAIRHLSDDEWRRVLAIDLDSAFFCSRRALSGMRARGTGSIVNVASRAWLGWWGQSAYAAAKAGLVGLTRALAIEMASRGVRVNAVAPGLIETPMLLDRTPDALERLTVSVPVDSIGTPDDIAGAVSYLASERARVVTGQVLYVGGGKNAYAYPDWRS